jgi:hypothetical protein
MPPAPATHPTALSLRRHLLVGILLPIALFVVMDTVQPVPPGPAGGERGL